MYLVMLLAGRSTHATCRAETIQTGVGAVCARHFAHVTAQAACLLRRVTFRSQDGPSSRIVRSAQQLMAGLISTQGPLR